MQNIQTKALCIIFASKLLGGTVINLDLALNFIVSTRFKRRIVRELQLAKWQHGSNNNNRL